MRQGYNVVLKYRWEYSLNLNVTHCQSCTETGLGDRLTGNREFTYLR